MKNIQVPSTKKNYILVTIKNKLEIKLAGIG